jgi:uncharacterized phage-associated protein
MINPVAYFLVYITTYQAKKGVKMDNKTSELLAYITMKHPKLSITSLMKLSYLIDLVHIKKTNKQISSFNYSRYKYGPFDNSIYEYISSLVGNDIIKEDSELTPYGGEYIVYYCDDDEITFDNLSIKEQETIDEVINSVIGFGAKALVELAYRTKPMQKIGATVGGNEHLDELLDLRAK